MPFDATPIPAVTSALMNARQKLVEHGWIQHNMRGQLGTCMVGAFDGRETGSHLLIAAIEDLGIDPTARNIPMFNDRPGRTKAEVLAVFDRAIELSWIP